MSWFSFEEGSEPSALRDRDIGIDGPPGFEATPKPEVPDLSAAHDSDIGIDGPPEIGATPQASSLGAGELILVCRELTGLSQRQLASRAGTSQPTLAVLETGNRVPTVRTLLTIAEAAGLELVVGLRRPEAPRPDPDALGAMGFALIGTLHRNTQDDLADFVALREPSPSEGPR